MFTEESRSTAVAGSAESGDYKYKVNYNLSGNNLTSLHCNVYKKVSEEVTTSTGTQTVEREVYVGIMFQESGNKQFSFPQDTDITPHVAVFEEILSEVKAKLISDNTTAE
ncbi:hypothetical protein [uncultured Bacteroides sp.]|uniref:hypothetical protein n=1 Tax=uncultured Bacteroides sp. TaxID=162156 RepID=UPI002AAAAA4C|nr:hypothetical protein [uncultured Bacteroides sp.]